jgi:hypothetical protein
MARIDTQPYNAALAAVPKPADRKGQGLRRYISDGGDAGRTADAALAPLGGVPEGYQLKKGADGGYTVEKKPTDWAKWAILGAMGAAAAPAVIGAIGGLGGGAAGAATSGKAGALGALGKVGGAAKALGDVSQVAGRAAAAGAQGRSVEGALTTDYDRNAIDLGRLLLEQQKFASDEQGAAARRAVMAELIGSIGDYALTVPGVPRGTSAGGPAIGPVGDAIAQLLSQQAANTMRSGTSFAPIALTPLPKVGLGEKALGLMGTIGSLAGALPFGRNEPPAQGTTPAAGQVFPSVIRGLTWR